VPGNPGASWTQDQILIMKAKFLHYFTTRDNAPKHLRLGFHDCIKYADGTGGCDGCLNWKGMDVTLDIVGNSRSLSVEDGGGNNGLGDTVRNLEQMYTKPDFPPGGPVLEASPIELGWSRADLWAFSSLIAVEHGVMVNNLKCDEVDLTEDRGPSMRGCTHHKGEPDCKVNIERPFQFYTGRSDCTEHDSEFPYKATKEEKHPSATDAGRKTIEYFQTEFPDLTGRDIVALMGAHTMGQPNIHISQFPYQWTSQGGRMFNNDYYRNIVGEDRWFFNINSCEKIGNAFREKPKTDWVAHTRMTSENGGPVFWIHRNHVCPACSLEEGLKGMSLELWHWEMDCCHNKPEGAYCRPDRESADMEDDNINAGCERMRFIAGADEIALNAEMGLYKQFEVDDYGVIYGCPGLEIFNRTMRGTKGRTTWSELPGGYGPQEPECEKQMIEHPAGSGEPLYTLFEEYASNQQNFVRDFVIAMEKMLANGYSEGLTQAPDHWTDVSCPLPSGKWTPFICYKTAPGSVDSMESTCVEKAVASGSSFQIKNDKDQKVLQVADDGSVSMSKGGDQMWQWATNACNKDFQYLSSVPSGAILANDGKTVTDQLDGNTWAYDATEKTLYSPRGYISGTKRRGQKMDWSITRCKKGSRKGLPWKFFCWNLA